MEEFDVRTQCILCGKQPGGICSEDEWHFSCKYCGYYRILANEEPYFENLRPEVRIRLSGLVRELNGEGFVKTPLLSRENLAALLSQTPERFDVSWRARKLLKALARTSIRPGQFVPLVRANDANLAYGSPTESDDFEFIVDFLRQSDLIKADYGNGGMHEVQITAAGWEELQHRPRTESNKAFVAMWFGTEVEKVFPDAIQPAVAACGYRAIKIDIEQFNDGIVDRVIAEIKESRFLVADLTGNRNGVYFEAGFAKGLGLEVIWTVRDDHAKETHFDAKHLNQIRWKTTDELKKRLESRIRATVGKGPLATVGD